MMSSAQLDLQPLDDAFAPLGVDSGIDPGVDPVDAAETEAAPARFALKEQVAERLAAHRARRGHPPVSSAASGTVPAKARSARIAATVAERYAQSQTYRDFLAEEAERAIRQAEAAAEVAALNAQAVAAAQYQLLAELDHWTPPEPLATPPPDPAPASALLAFTPDAPSPPAASSSLTVRLYEDAEDAPRNPAGRSVPSPRSQDRFIDEAEGLAALYALDEEIAFRQSPVFDEPAGPTVDIPANLIQFPRQLIAARKARPRLAEGPLREDAAQAAQHPQTAQLRIFEVEADLISTTPSIEPIEHAGIIEPVWSSILLGARPASAPVESTEPVFNPVLSPQAAPLSLRIMAGIVDGCLILAAFLAFAAAFVFTLGNLAGTRLAAGPIQTSGAANLQTAALSVVVVLGALALLYHLLFFTFAEATPGMIYARIGLCTLNDENPTRSAMRRRLLAMALSACPLGIGFFWACLDDDKLGWHDRISRMYQRSY